MPPLRERKEDIPILAAHFLEAACKRFNRPGLQLTDSQIQELLSYDWPGNVRELQNVVERAVIAARSGSLQFDILEAPQSDTSARGQSGAALPEEPGVIPDAQIIKLRERANIIAALRRSNGKIHGPGGAAELLGIKPTTLSARIKKLGIKQIS